MPPPSPAELIRAWVKAFNRCDAEAMAAFYAPGATLVQIPEQPVAGAPAIRTWFEEQFAGPDQIMVLEHLLEQGEWAVLEWRDPQGPRGCACFQVLDGRITVQRTYLDRMSFLRQHGLPVPRDLA